MKTSLTIDRFENKNAVLINKDGEQIFWPKDKLPEGVKEGSILNFNIFSDEEERKNKNKKAKDILNEILDTSESQ